MKITVYTITDCKFSEQEKEYLQSHNLAFEEKNLETNHEYLSEMLRISNNFAGTPVTVIVKDTKPEETEKPAEDQVPLVLKGFTKEEFDKALGFTEEKTEQTKTEDQTQKTSDTDQKTDNENAAQEPTVTIMPAQPAQTADQTQSVTPPTVQQPAEQPQSVTNETQQQNSDSFQTAVQGTDNPEPVVQMAADPQPAQTPAQPVIEVDPSLPAVPSSTAQPAQNTPQTPVTDTPAPSDDTLDEILKDLQAKAKDEESATNPPAPQPVA